MHFLTKLLRIRDKYSLISLSSVHKTYFEVLAVSEFQDKRSPSFTCAFHLIINRLLSFGVIIHSVITYLTYPHFFSVSDSPCLHAYLCHTHFHLLISPHSHSPALHLQAASLLKPAAWKRFSPDGPLSVSLMTFQRPCSFACWFPTCFALRPCLCTLPVNCLAFCV